MYVSQRNNISIISTWSAKTHSYLLCFNYLGILILGSQDSSARIPGISRTCGTQSSQNVSLLDLFLVKTCWMHLVSCGLGLTSFNHCLSCTDKLQTCYPTSTKQKWTSVRNLWQFSRSHQLTGWCSLHPLCRLLTLAAHTSRLAFANDSCRTTHLS